MTDSTTPPTDPLILGPSPVAPDFPRTLIIAPPRPLMALKASMISKILSWTRDDVVLANRTFRAVYAKHMHSHREEWLLLPPGVVDTAVVALKEANPRLFAGLEGDWYLIWGLYKRHAQRWRQNPPGERAVDKLRRK